MRKEVKRCIEYYLENINSDKFKEYEIKSEIEGRKTHEEYIEQEKPQWRNRIDCYADSDITNILICDVLSNNGVVELLKKLYSLPKDRFKVKNYYKKPSIINKYDYIHLQYSQSGFGRFAEIKLLKDKYIESIDISWVQINSYFAYLEYNFTFKKCLDNKLYNQFIYDNIKELNSKDYLIRYHINKQNDDNFNFLSLEQMNYQYFSLICQHYITNFLYSEQGRNNQLINMIFRTRKECIDIDKMYLGDICVSYYNKESNYVIISDLEGENYSLLSGNNIIPSFSLCGAISKYGNDFYYRFFGDRELIIFENEFSEFSTGRKKVTYNKKLRVLLNKMQSLSDFENKKFSDFYKEFNKKWDFYESNDKMKLEKYHINNIEKYKGIYRDNFSYLKMLSEMNYTKSNKINAIVAIFISLLATIISIIAWLNN